MHASVRSFATTGVALVGASVIAVTPIAPAPPDIQVSKQAVSLSAISDPADPFVAYEELVANTIGNLSSLGGQFAADPAPILVKIFQNQVANGQLLGSALEESFGFILQGVEALPGTLEEAFALLTQGDLEGAVDAFVLGIVPAALGLLVPFVAASMIITNTADNFARAVSAVFDPENLLFTVLGFAGPALSTLNGFVATGQAVIDGVLAGDPMAVVNSLVSAPAVIIDAALNGSGAVLGFIPLPGLLTAVSPTNPVGGPIATLLNIRTAIADALQPVEQVTSLSTASPSTASPMAAEAEEQVEAVAAVTNVSNENFRTVNLTTDSSTPVEDPVAGETEKDAADGGVETTDGTESLDLPAGEEGDALTDVEPKDESTNGGTDLSDGNKANPPTTVGTSTGSVSKGKSDDAKPRPGVKKMKTSKKASGSE
ncbi:hypothetical protein [Mycolicibacterium thermoresistibile]